MNSVGIVCEFDLLHRGHAFLLGEAARRTGLPAVCVMSGDVTQRGSFAVFRKHARAEAAVRCGAGLVVELPAPWVLSSAEGFAAGAAAILAALGCTCLAFGSESGDGAGLLSCARALASPAADAAIRAAGPETGYGAARQAAAEGLCQDAALLKNPNDLLAAEYLAAGLRRGWIPEPVPVLRQGRHDGEGSASRLRALLEQGGLAALPEGAVPERALAVFRREAAAGRGPVLPGELDRVLLARLRTMTRPEAERLPGAADGLGARLLAAAEAPTLPLALARAKTKVYAMSRLRRAALCAGLGITAADCRGLPPYIRVLALDETGRELLRSAPGEVPILTKPAAVRAMGERAERCFTLGARAADLQSLAFPDPAERTGGQDWRRNPVLCTESTALTT